MAGIVISYRRDDAQGETGHLASELRERFGADRVFLDVVAIQPGMDFRKAIDSAVQKAEVLLVIIGRSWLTVKNDRGQRRLDDPADLVRLEIATALERNVPVIPVLVQGAAAPAVEELPKNLEGLAWRNAVEISHARWDYDTGKLVEALGTILNPQETPKGQSSERAARFLARPTRTVAGAFAAIAIVTLLAVQPWKASESSGQPTIEPSEATAESAPGADAPPSQGSPEIATPGPTALPAGQTSPQRSVLAGLSVSRPAATAGSKVDAASVRKDVDPPMRNTAPEQSTAPGAKSSGTTPGAPSPAVTNSTGNASINAETPGAAKPSAGAEPASSRSKLLGTWLTPFVASPYGKPDFSVRLTFEVFGGEIVGTVTIAGQKAGRGQTQPLDMLDLAIDGETASFKTRFFGALCEGEAYAMACVGGPPDPSEFYRATLVGEQLFLTRRNNLRGGDAVEKLVAIRH